MQKTNRRHRNEKEHKVREKIERPTKMSQRKGPRRKRTRFEPSQAPGDKMR